MLYSLQGFSSLCTSTLWVPHPNQDNIDSYFRRARDWVQGYIRLGAAVYKEMGHAGVTPYIHTMVYHVPRVLKLYGSLELFTEQGPQGIIKNLFYFI